MLELHATMWGNVQAVGFRATAQLFAREFKLKGFAQNRSNGAVEIVAQGNKEDLEQFLANLKQNFQITKTEAEYVKPEKHYEGFSILS